MFFNGYDIDKEIELHIELNRNKKDLYTENVRKQSLDKKILFLTSRETKQRRYYDQVNVPFVKDNEKELLIKRLGTVFSPDEKVQVRCDIHFANENHARLFSAMGLADVVKDDVVYELKFVSELKHEHFLQCASYIVALGLNKGILWNTRNNKMFEITIPDRNKFLDAVVNAVTKNAYIKYYAPAAALNAPDKIAVIDTETNWKDEVMSIGVVIADKNSLNPIDFKYYIFDPEYKIGGIYSGSLNLSDSHKVITISCKDGIADLSGWLKINNIKSVFAYNANFDLSHLPELNDFSWYDIMKIAAYRQYNPKIPIEECYKTGRMKKNYGVESMIRLVSGNNDYRETHNALKDAQDELRLMRLLGIDLKEYACAKLVKKPLSLNVSIQCANNKKAQTYIQQRMITNQTYHPAATAKSNNNQNAKPTEKSERQKTLFSPFDSEKNFKVGDKVHCPSIGICTVVKVFSIGRFSLYKVKSDASGEVTLITGFAKLTKIE